MRIFGYSGFFASLCLLTCSAGAADFDAYGSAPAELVAIENSPGLVIELGVGVGASPVYEGAEEYGATVVPIIKIDRLNIPGFIDIDASRPRDGFTFAPSVSIAGERISADHEMLEGMEDIDATYALGGRVGYIVGLTDGVTAEVYGAARYAFGGAEGLIGEAGVELTARLSPQMEIVGGPVVSFASDDYMNTYYGVSASESVASGGRLEAFDATGGIKSAGIDLSLRYEVVPDLILSATASYSKIVGDAVDSPIVRTGSEDSFGIGVGLSRRFSFDF